MSHSPCTLFVMRIEGVLPAAAATTAKRNARRIGLVCCANRRSRVTRLVSRVPSRYLRSFTTFETEKGPRARVLLFVRYTQPVALSLFYSTAVDRIVCSSQSTGTEEPPAGPGPAAPAPKSSLSCCCFDPGRK